MAENKFKKVLIGILFISLLLGIGMFSISSPSGVQPESDDINITRYVNSKQDLRDRLPWDCVREQALSVNNCKNVVTSTQYGDIQLEYKNDFNLGIWSELGANLACDDTTVKFSVKNQKTGAFELFFSQQADDDEQKYFTNEPCTNNIILNRLIEYDEKADRFYYNCINQSFTVDYINEQNKVDVIVYIEGDANLGVEDHYSCHPEIAVSVINKPINPNPIETSFINDSIEFIKEIIPKTDINDSEDIETSLVNGTLIDVDIQLDTDEIDDRTTIITEELTFFEKIKKFIYDIFKW